jgi:hypothetical protein
LIEFIIFFQLSLNPRRERRKCQSPKGTSSYQAAWIVDSGGEEDDNEESTEEEEEDDEVMAVSALILSFACRSRNVIKGSKFILSLERSRGLLNFSIQFLGN